MLNTDDDILICDPEGEYAPLVEAMGDLGSVIRVSAGGRDRLNAMYMVDGYGENNPIVVKSEFIMSLIEQIDKKGVGPQHKSIIDRCITNVYRNAAEDGTVPTLCTLRDMLLEQPNRRQSRSLCLLNFIPPDLWTSSASRAMSIWTSVLWCSTFTALALSSSPPACWLSPIPC
jgi:hypothetical protein